MIAIGWLTDAVPVTSNESASKAKNAEWVEWKREWNRKVKNAEWEKLGWLRNKCKDKESGTGKGAAKQQFQNFAALKEQAKLW